MRLAWFSPMPPVPSGIATCSAELVDELAARHTIDVYVHDSPAIASQRTTEHPVGVRVMSAHDFVWRHRADPYDLTVYQVGNSSHHDYMWPYLFRYPGLTVLHDAHVHHARAASLLRTKRAADFRREFAANHPDASVDIAELAIAGFDNHLHYFSPMSRVIVEGSRLTAVHSGPLARQLADDIPDGRITAIRLAHGRLLSPAEIERARKTVCDRFVVPRDAVVFGVFGGLAPDKRISAILAALEAILPYAPSARLLLAGAPARHYDLAADVRDRGLEDRVTMTGYLSTDAELTDCIAACDISLNLRWPTAREMSGPWLRALAAGRPTVTIDLTHLVDVPSIDPRTWRRNPGSGIRSPGSGIRSPGSVIRDAGSVSRDPGSVSRDPGSVSRDPGSCETRTKRIPDWTSDAAHAASRMPDPDPDPVTIAIDILDEDHSLRLAMRRLATDPKLRASLGAAGRRYWESEHSMPRMVEDYERVIAQAAALSAPPVSLPAHLFNDGQQVLDQVLTQFSLSPVWQTSRPRDGDDRGLKESR